ncbi:MAG: hypothetical protein CSB44_01910 [Gammaproteobacteria bacterium]|nr:MAG: hypothetical protein CSB44_01910 [Gammaproteobacteria bacterium]
MTELSSEQQIFHPQFVQYVLTVQSRTEIDLSGQISKTSTTLDVPKSIASTSQGVFKVTEKDLMLLAISDDVNGAVIRPIFGCI